MSKVDVFWLRVAAVTECEICPFAEVRCTSDATFKSCAEIIKTAYIKAAVEDRQTAREDSDAPV